MQDRSQEDDGFLTWIQECAIALFTDSVQLPHAPHSKDEGGGNKQMSTPGVVSFGAQGHSWVGLCSSLHSAPWNMFVQRKLGSCSSLKYKGNILSSPLSSLGCVCHGYFLSEPGATVLQSCVTRSPYLRPWTPEAQGMTSIQFCIFGFGHSHILGFQCLLSESCKCGQMNSFQKEWTVKITHLAATGKSFKDFLLLPTLLVTYFCSYFL